MSSEQSRWVVIVRTKDKGERIRDKIQEKKDPSLREACVQDDKSGRDEILDNSSAKT
jgi:hypothetical protein